MQKQPPKSPPLAFEKTPNDALVPLTSPQHTLESVTSPSRSAMAVGRFTPPSQEAQSLQAIVDQQNGSIDLLHQAFAAERRVWSLEKERLHERIASLEKLLKTGDGYSPAKSPVLSPFNSSNLTSPLSKPTNNPSRLPSIAENESLQSLSQRREGAPQSINFSSSTSALKGEQAHTEGYVSFGEAKATAVETEEIPSSSFQPAKAASPAPYNYRMDAGHTPLKAPERPVHLPHNGMSMDGIGDTPTRNNTHINAFLTRSNDEEEDKELQGPLNMPELPNCPDEANFTFEMLSKRLEQLESHPEAAKPDRSAQSSSGFASPAEHEDQEFSPKTVDAGAEVPLAPATTRNPDSRLSETNSHPLSPSTTSDVAVQFSQQVTREEKVQQDFESGGIKLKKKASVNFGAPFGSLGGFGSVRKQS